MIDINTFGKDHWSTFAYFESVGVDYDGKIDNRRMRCNSRLHRELAHSVDGSMYPTITKIGNLENHDDWSCAEDLEQLGLIITSSKRINNGMFGNTQVTVRLTEYGHRIAAQLRKFKAEGGRFQDFVPETDH